eukprot:gene4511-5625_t
MSSTTTTTTAVGPASSNNSNDEKINNLRNQLIQYLNGNLNVEQHDHDSDEKDSKDNLEIPEQQHTTSSTTTTDHEKQFETTIFTTSIDELNLYSKHFINDKTLLSLIFNNIRLDHFGLMVVSLVYSKFSIHKKICTLFLTFINRVSTSVTKSRFICAPHLGIDTCLICIYNQEFIKREGKEKVFNPPSLSFPSFIYRNPEDQNSSNTAQLTENMVKMLNSQSSNLVIEGTLPRIESITTQTKTTLFRVVLQIYVSQLSFLPDLSRSIFCEMVTRLSGNGFHFQPSIELLESTHNNSSLNESKYNQYDGDEQLSIPLNNSSGSYSSSGNNKPNLAMSNNNNNNNSKNQKGTITTYLGTIKSNQQKRIYLTVPIYQELITGLTFCAYNKPTEKEALIAIKTVNERSNLELTPEIMLVTNSLIKIFNQSLKK